MYWQNMELSIKYFTLTVNAFSVKKQNLKKTVYFLIINNLLKNHHLLKQIINQILKFT
ncbi:hypothetical protein M2254_000768 [Chryseobacterium sp. BIGb0186]|nr:hypothetical protein [Chryseobacterium sp. JUb44]MDH6209184.1 hypothetical protein [Chryseobacterium sp. BIGb0186]